MLLHWIPCVWGFSQARAWLPRRRLVYGAHFYDGFYVQPLWQLLGEGVTCALMTGFLDSRVAVLLNEARHLMAHCCLLACMLARPLCIVLCVSRQAVHNLIGCTCARYSARTGCMIANEILVCEMTSMHFDALT